MTDEKDEIILPENYNEPSRFLSSFFTTRNNYIFSLGLSLFLFTRIVDQALCALMRKNEEREKKKESVDFHFEFSDDDDEELD